MRYIEATQSPDEYLQHYLGYSLSSLMAPIGADQVGESVRHNGVYFNIKAARESDDASLPMGVWTHELKTADWHEVKSLALTALENKSKDLQLGVWLFEANLHLDGFAGIAPSAFLIQALCEQYWPNMHPQMVDSDIEYRTNPFNWLNDKLTDVIRTIPMTSTQLDGSEYCWNDWASAQHYERLKKQQKLPPSWDGVTPALFKQRLAATSSEFLTNVYCKNFDGLQALQQLNLLLDKCCGDDSPNLLNMTGIVKEINEMVANELERRGILVSANEENDPNKQLMAESEQGDQNGDAEQHSDDKPSGGGGGSGNGPIRDRAEAFVALRKAAEFLMNDDPHSPVPYLVHTACDWGNKSAPDLYQELFLTQGGQLNIFEIMGLDIEQKE